MSNERKAWTDFVKAREQVKAEKETPKEKKGRERRSAARTRRAEGAAEAQLREFLATIKGEEGE